MWHLRHVYNSCQDTKSRHSGLPVCISKSRDDLVFLPDSRQLQDMKTQKHNRVVGIVRANHIQTLSALPTHSPPLKKGIERIALKC